MEDNLNFLKNEDDLIVLKRKTTSNKICNQKWLKVKTMIVATLRVTVLLANNR